MPLDVLQQIDEEKKILANSSDNSELISSLTEIQEKAGKSSEVLSVLNSIINSMTSRGKDLHDCISDVVKDFEAYDTIATKSRKATSALSAEYSSLGANGISGISRINDSITQSLSLLQTVEREAKKYGSSLSKISNIGIPSFSKVPMQGSISIPSGIPGRNDSGRDAKMEFISRKISSSIDKYAVKHEMSGTKESSKKKIESNIDSLRELQTELDKISSIDLSDWNLEGDIEKLFKKLSKGTIDLGSDISSILNKVKTETKRIANEEERRSKTQQRWDERRSKRQEKSSKEEEKRKSVQERWNKRKNLRSEIEQAPKNLSKYSPDAQKYGIDLVRQNVIASSKNATDAQKEKARKLVDVDKTAIDYTQEKYLSGDERKRRTSLLKQLDSAKTVEEKEKITGEIKERMTVIDNYQQKVGIKDAVGIGIQKEADAKVQNVKQQWSGDPTGFAAVGAAAMLVTKELIDYGNQIKSTVEEMAKLSIASKAVEASFDSSFGEGKFSSLRDELNLTNQEMLSLAPTIQDAYRSSGVELEHIAQVAENIKNNFGTLDPSKLNEALSVMKELTSEQTKFLMTGVGSSETQADTYTNLLKSRKAGQAADLLEQGVLGNGENPAGISSEDQQIVKGIQEVKKITEQISMWGKDIVGIFGGWGPKLLALSGAAVTATGGVLSVASTGVAVKELLKKVHKGSSIKVTETSKGNGGGGSDALSDIATDALSGAKGGKALRLGKMALKGKKGLMRAGKLALKGGTKFLKANAAGLAGLAAEAGVHYVADTVSAGSRKRIAEEDEKNEKIQQTSEELGFKTNTKIKDSIDWDRVNKAGADAAKQWATAAGVVGSAATLASGFFTGGASLAPGAVLTAKGVVAAGAAGYAYGSAEELRKQTGGTYKNYAFQTTNEKGENVFNLELYKSLQDTNKSIEEIQKNNKETAKKREKSLRGLEKTGALIDKINSGQFSSSNRENINAAKLSMANASNIGGNDAMFSSMAGSIAKNSASAFRKEMQSINDGIKRNNDDKDMDGEARLTANRELYAKQAEIIQKFVESVQDSIGEYDKIPSVIQSSLREKVRNLNLDFSAKNFSGTSEEAFEELNKNATEAGNKLAATSKKLKQDIDANENMKKEVEKKTAVAIDNVKKNKNVDILSSDGKTIDAEKYKKEQAKNKKEEDELNKQIGKEIGVENLAELDSSIIDIKRVTKEIEAIEEELKNPENKNKYFDSSDGKNEEFDKKREEYIGKLTEQLANLNKLAKKKDVGEFSGIAKAQAGHIQKLIENIKKYKQSDWKTEAEEQENFTAQFGTAGAIANKANVEYQKKLQGTNEKYSAKKNKIAENKNTLTAAGAALNANTAYESGRAKIFTSHNDILNSVIKNADKLVNASDSDPVINLRKKQIEEFKAEELYMIEIGDAATSYEKSISTQFDIIKKRRELIKRSGEEIKKLEAQIQESLNGVTLSKEAQEYINASKRLSDLRMNGGSKEDIEAAEKDLDTKRKTLKKKDSKEFDFAKNIVKSQDALNSAKQNQKQNEAQVKSDSVALMNRRIDEMQSYKKGAFFKTMGAVQSSYSKQIEAAGMSLDQATIDSISEKAKSNAAEERDKGIADATKQYQKAMAGFDDDFKNASTEEERQLVLYKKQEATAKYLEDVEGRKVAFAKQVLDFEKQRVAAAERSIQLDKESIDIQLDLAQSIGAPMETIVAMERQRVQHVQKEAELANQSYEKAKKSGDENAIKEARNKANRANAEVIKSQLGAQRSVMEKTFGNMIGSFSETAGIKGPGNLAGKYGFGYMTDSSGSNVRRASGKNTGGLQGRKFAANAGGINISAPTRDESIPGGNSPSALANKGGSNSNMPAAAPKVNVAQASKGATAKSKSMEGFNTLGEKFKDTKEGVEIAVFWEKKIYNLLEDNFKSMESGNAKMGKTQEETTKELSKSTKPNKSSKPASLSNDNKYGLEIDKKHPKTEKLIESPKARIRRGKGIPTIPEVDNPVDAKNINDKSKDESVNNPAKTVKKKLLKTLRIASGGELGSLVGNSLNPTTTKDDNPVSTKSQETLPQLAKRLTQGYVNASPNEKYEMLQSYKKQLDSIDVSKLSDTEKESHLKFKKMLTVPAFSPMQATVAANPMMYPTVAANPMMSPMMAAAEGFKNLSSPISEKNFKGLSMHLAYFQRKMKSPEPVVGSGVEKVLPNEPPVETKKDTTKNSPNNKEVNSQKSIIEVNVKFNNQMFENQISKIVTSPSMARNIVSAGMGK